MEPRIREYVEGLVKSLTTTGERTLEKERYSELLQILKEEKGTDAISTVFEFSMTQLKVEHAQVRYLSMQLFDRLFCRSRTFRKSVVDEIDTVTLLCFGSAKSSLPPPFEWTALLQESAMEIISRWESKYGDAIPQLRVAKRVLEKRMGASLIASIEERERMAEKSERQSEERSRLLIQRAKNVLSRDIPSMFRDIGREVAEAERVLDVLVPGLDLMDREKITGIVSHSKGEKFERMVSAAEEEEVSGGPWFGRGSYSLEIEIPSGGPVAESIENRPVFGALRDCVKVLSQRRGIISEWERTLSGARSEDQGENERISSALRRVIWLSNRLKKVLRQSAVVGVEELVDADDADDALFVSVPEAVSVEKNEDEREAHQEVKGDEDCPGSGKRLDRNSKDGEKDPKTLRRRLAALAPRIPPALAVNWDVKSTDTVPLNRTGIEREHRFFGTPEEKEIPVSKLGSMQELSTSLYPTRQRQQSRICGAPLRNGKGLCQRRDLEVCPFHGPIAERDTNGHPIQSDAGRASQPSPVSSTSKRGTPRRRIDLSAFVEIAQGCPDLVPDILEQAQPKRKRRKKQPETALVDLKKARKRKGTHERIRSAIARRRGKEDIQPLPFTHEICRGDFREHMLGENFPNRW